MSAAGAQLQLFAGGPADPVRWRLLSGNNREIGRSAVGYRDAEQCRQAVGDLRRALPALTAKLRRADAHRWRWELRQDGTAVVVAGHSFDRQIRCELALAQFRAEFATAVVRPGVVHSGARRWGSVAS